MLSNYKLLLKEQGYIKVLVANVISDFGNSMDNIAFSWMVYEITNNATWIAIIFGASMLPMIFLQPIFGVFVERVSKKRIILLADFLGMLIMFITATLYILNLLNPVILLVMTLINASIESLRIPAGVAMVPKILSKENYTNGTALSRSACQISSLIGLSATGFILGVFGIQAALIIDGITFLISFLIISTIKYKEKIVEVTEKNKMNMKRFTIELKEGFTYLSSNKTLSSVCLWGVVINFVMVPLNTYNALFIGDYLNLSVEVYSIVSMCFTIGMLLGSVLSPMIMKKIKGKKLFLICGIGIGLYYLVLYATTLLNIKWLIVLILITATIIQSILSSATSVLVSVKFMECVDEDYMARAASIFNSSVTMASPIATIGLTFLSIFMGVDFIFVLFGILIIIYAILFDKSKRARNI